MFFTLPMLLAFIQDANGPAVAKKEVEVVAQILISKQVNPFGAAPNQQLPKVEDYVAESMAILGSEYLVKRALDAHRLSSLASFKGIANTEADILRSLSVSRDAAKNPNVISLSYSSADAKDGIAVLSAVVSAFQDYLDRQHNRASLELFEKAKHSRDEIHAQLARLVEELLRLRQESTAFVGHRDHKQVLAALQMKIGEVRIKQLEVEGRLAWAESAIENGRPLALVLKANEWAARSGYDKLKDKVGDSIAGYIENLKAERDELRVIGNALTRELREAANIVAQIMEQQSKETLLQNNINTLSKYQTWTMEQLTQQRIGISDMPIRVLVLQSPQVRQARPQRP